MSTADGTRARMRWWLAGAIAGLALLAGAIEAPAAQRSHGLSTFGDLKYPQGFTHFDYVNPDAPKGGHLSTIGIFAIQTFDSFNPFIIRGNAAQYADTLLFDSLMARATDEPDAVYGLVADWAEVADDKRSVTFHIRPEAHFSDGTPVTADDVAFTLVTLKEKGSPDFGLALRDVVRATAIDKQTVRYEFQGERLRDLPVYVATLPILSKAWYTAHDFAQPSLDVPLGSGPYRIGRYDEKSYVTYERRQDYWAKDLPVNRGRWNFDAIRIDYYADRTVALQAFLAGDLDLREELTARDWANGYNTDAVRQGRIQRIELPDGTPSGTQGLFMNLRRAKFQDARTRQALDLAFDFEWTRKNFFYGSYQRTASYFESSEMKATGKPTPEELALLEPFRAKLPPEVFGDAVVSPVTDGSGQDRALLHKARQLLEAAGWKVQDGKLVDAAGQPFTIEFLLDDGGIARILGPYIKNLQVLGIEASIRTVDAAQYEDRQKHFDYDVVSVRYTMALTPGLELRNDFSSAAADSPSSNNLAGIKDPVVDALIERVIEAKSRTELLTATHALDRVLRAGRYWVPSWYSGQYRIAYWDRLSRPATSPRYDRGILDTWWYDKDKDKKLALP